MPRTPPGQTRERVLAYVRERLQEGRPPTVREVQKAFRFRAVETARGHLEALVREGRLSKRDGEARGLALPEHEPRKPFRRVPVLGQVAAGALSTAVEDREGYLNVESRVPESELFALRVRGESMTGAGILPGDLAVVRRQPDASSGDIVVAVVDDEATLKRLRRHRGRVELHPENPDYDIIQFPAPAEARNAILGKVIEIRRQLDSTRH